MRSDQLTKPWMQLAIEAVYAHGVQKYVLIHTYEQMKMDL